MARKQNRENIYSIVFEGDSPRARPKPGSKFDYKRTIESDAVHTVPRTTRSYSEIPVTKRFFPLSYSVQPVEDLEMVNLLSYREKGYTSQEISSIFWSVDWNYSSPYNDKEYICNKCGLYRDYNLDQIKFNLKVKLEKE